MKYKFTNAFYKTNKKDEYFISIESPEEYDLLMEMLEHYTKYTWGTGCYKPTSRPKRRNVATYIVLCESDDHRNVLHGLYGEVGKSNAIPLKDIVELVKIKPYKLKQY